MGKKGFIAPRENTSVDIYVYKYIYARNPCSHALLAAVPQHLCLKLGAQPSGSGDFSLMLSIWKCMYIHKPMPHGTEWQCVHLLRKEPQTIDYACHCTYNNTVHILQIFPWRGITQFDTTLMYGIYYMQVPHHRQR